MPSVVITGANRGIGLEFAKWFKSHNWHVVATARDTATAAEKEKVLNSMDHLLPLNVSDETSIASFSQSLADNKVKIDLLINNAGVLVRDDLVSAKGHDLIEQFTVNAVGPFLLTQSLVRNKVLAGPAKVVNITSRMGSIEDNTSGAYYGYRASKAALNMITKSLAIDLKPQNITVFALHPGFIRTDMTGGQGEMDPMEAVQRMVKAIDQISESGGFWHRDGYKLPN